MTAMADVRLPEIKPNSSIIKQSNEDYMHNSLSELGDSSPMGEGGRIPEGYQDDNQDDTMMTKEGGTGKAGSLLSRYDVDRFRKSYLNIIYVAMLEEGYNRSYRELYNLVTSQVTRKEKAGPNSFIWFKPLIRDNQQNLETLSYFLCRSEEAEREGNLFRVYAERQMLAEYFKEQNNAELATHFYRSCLQISNDIDDEGLTHAQANCNMGDDVFSRGEINNALEYYENYYSLTRDQSWTNHNGVSLVQDACVKLLQVYLKLGDQNLSTDEKKTAVAHYRKAQEFADASGVAEYEALTNYKLANSLMEIGAFTEAISIFKEYKEKCEQIDDVEGMGQAVYQISRALLRQGQTDEAVKTLKQYAEEARSQGLLALYSKACSSLAEIYNSQGNFKEASLNSKESFATLKEANVGSTSEVFDSTMAQFGVCHGNEMAATIFQVMANACKERSSLESLIFWKNGRNLNPPQKPAISKNLTDLTEMSEDQETAPTHEDLEPLPEDPNEQMEVTEENPTIA